MCLEAQRRGPPDHARTNPRHRTARRPCPMSRRSAISCGAGSETTTGQGRCRRRWKPSTPARLSPTSTEPSPSCWSRSARCGREAQPRSGRSTSPPGSSAPSSKHSRSESGKPPPASSDRSFFSPLRKTSTTTWPAHARRPLHRGWKASRSDLPASEAIAVHELDADALALSHQPTSTGWRCGSTSRPRAGVRRASGWVPHLWLTDRMGGRTTWC